jgi:uncharacterized membrane protein
VIKFKPSRLAAASLGAAGAFLTLPSAAGAQTLQVTKMCSCAVTHLSADGSAATGILNENLATFRWTKEKGVKGLGRSTARQLDGAGAGIPSISDDGRTIASTIMDDTNTYGTEGRWTVGGGWEQLGPVPLDGGILDSFDSSVFGMSGDGSTVTGLYWRPNQSGGSAHGSVWTAAGGMIGMPTNGRSSRIDGANHDGTVLIGWEEDPQTGVRLAVVWKNGTKTFIDDGGGVGWPSEATGISSDGTIVVGQAVDPVLQQEVATMWKWDGAVWQKTSLGLGPNSDSSGSSYALGVSDDGAVVVGMYRTTFDTFSSGGFVWTQPAGVVDAQAWLKSNGVHLGKRLYVYEVPAVSRDGRSIGVLAQQIQAPFANRSLLVTQVNGSRIK